MFKRIRSKIGIKLLGAFSLALILSMVSLIYVATQLLAEFGEFSTSKNEANIKDNTYAFLTRITHEQAMRYDSIFQKIAAASSLIAKQASHVHAHRESYGEESLTPSEKLVVSPKNGIFSNGPSEKTMVLYWGSSTISSAIRRHITALSKLDLLLESSKESNPESVACYFVSESAIARYYPNIHGVDEIPSGFDIRKANWYVKSRPENNPERKTVWSNIYRDIVGQGLMTTASSPVYSGTGQYVGAVGIDVTLNSIVKDILGDIKSCHKMENMFSFLLDYTGKIIAFPPEYLEMFDLKIETDKLVDSSVILEKSMLESSNAEVRKIGEKMIGELYQVSQFSLNGHPYIVSSHFMPSTGWRLGVVVPESVIFASVQETRNALDTTFETMTTRFTIVALSFLLGTIIITVLYALKNIIRPINTLSTAALRVREGDLTTQIDFQREDEIGALAGSFNNMVKALRKGKELEEEYTQKLEQKVNERTLELRETNDEQENTLQMLKKEMAERKRAEEELRESRDYLDSLVNYASAPIVVWSPEFKITRFNHAFEHLTGYKAEEVIGKQLNLLFPKENRDESLNKIERTLSGEYWKSVEIPILRKDGNIQELLWNSANIYAEDGTMLIATIAQGTDITARKQAQDKLTASLKEKEVLLKEVHHRVKNNLQVISSLLNLQSQHIKDKESLEMFQESQNRVRSMALIHEKLYTSEDLAHIDIAAYIQDLTASLFSAYPVNNAIKITIAITDIFLTITTAIPCGLIINELVTNALKHAFPHQQKGTITVSMTPSTNDSLILTVSDTGIGFPEGIDFRNTATLGMQLVISLVEQLEGTITLDRSEGTRFRIEFRKQE
jgi:PAS domain S-box-containing protein